jgi:hypothetical protein
VAERDHDKVIASIAKSVLGPLGLRRKGRSRTWLDDHGWWLGVVEFQPSSWSRGTYLNVGGMFLWRPIGHLAFEVGPVRVSAFTSASLAFFEDDVRLKAEQAAREITLLRQELPSLEGVVDYYAARERQPDLYQHAHTATAFGLLGDMAACRERIDLALKLRDDPLLGIWHASEYLFQARESASDPTRFRDWTTSAIRSTREALRLPPCDWHAGYDFVRAAGVPKACEDSTSQ